MSDLIRVEGEKNLYREASSGAIVNKDNFGYSQYLSEKERRIQDKKDSIINPLRNNREKVRPKIVKEVANVVNIKDAINQLESGVKDID